MDDLFKLCNENNIFILIRNNLKKDETRCSDKQYFINIHDSDDDKTPIYRGYVDNVFDVVDEAYAEVADYLEEKNG